MTIKSHSHRMARNCTHSWFSWHVAIASSSITLVMFERGVQDEQNRERGLERLHLSYSKVSWTVCRWGNSEAMTVSIPYPVPPCPPFFCLLFSFSFLFSLDPCWRKGWNNLSLERVCKARRKDYPTHTSKLGSSLLSPGVRNDHSGLSDLPQAQWGQQCLSSFDLMEEGDWGRDWGAEKKE